MLWSDLHLGEVMHAIHTHSHDPSISDVCQSTVSEACGLYNMMCFKPLGCMTCFKSLGCMMCDVCIIISSTTNT